DMSKEQEKHFHEAPEEIDTSKFDGILYEMSEDEQIEKLAEAGFDVSLIGLEVPEKSESVGSGADGERTDDDLPFQDGRGASQLTRLNEQATIKVSTPNYLHRPPYLRMAIP